MKNVRKNQTEIDSECGLKNSTPAKYTSTAYERPTGSQLEVNPVFETHSFDQLSQFGENTLLELALRVVRQKNIVAFLNGYSREKTNVTPFC